MENREEAQQLLCDVLAVRSVNGKDDEGKVAEYLAEYFRKSGIDAKVDRIDVTHANVRAVLQGEDSDRKLLWNGHLDTVPYGSLEEWQTDPAEPVIKDGYLYARGASDMKSGLCAMVYALCQCKKSGKIPPHTIEFIGTCDEENSGIGARYAVSSGKFGHYDEMLIGEPTGLKAGIAQKGCIWLELEGRGKTSHGAYPWQGCSAVTHMISVTEKIKRYVESHSHGVLGKATANITQIEGGIAPNMIPDRCRVLMDIRTVPGMTAEELLGQAKIFSGEEGQAADGRFEVSVQIKNNRRAIELGTGRPLFLNLKESLEQENMSAELTGINFFTDASILAERDLTTDILLFGPGEPDMAHKPNERVELEKYQAAIRVLEHMLMKK